MRKMLFILFTLFFLNCHGIQYKATYTVNTPLDAPTKLVIPIYIDKTFSTQDKLAIDNAINQWNYVLNQQMLLKVVDYNFDMEPDILLQAQKGEVFVFLKVDNKHPGIPDKVPEDICRRTPKCKYTLAWVDKVGGHIMKVVRNRLKNEDVEYVVLHEIGHMLNLDHVTTEDTLMYNTYSKYAYLCVDQDSTRKVAKTYGLDVKHMNFCISKS